MLHKHKHYGKEVTELNQLEKKLLMTDMMMTTLMETKKLVSNDVEDVLVSALKSKLADTRRKISVELTGIDDDGTINVLELVEETIYGYSKFLNDLKRNLKGKENEERLSLLN
jgi:hypothetical protein